MECTVFRNLDNTEIFDVIVDKRYANILLHNFKPYESIEWRQMSIQMPAVTSLENILVRAMQFDMQTDIPTLKSILDLNTLYLSIYQFDRPIPNTLILDDLPLEQWERILRNNGLQHVICNELEDTLVYSFDVEFIRGIRENKQLSDRIVVNSLSDVKPEF